jgi:hypothetical protein
VWARWVIFAHKHQRFDVGASAFPRIAMVYWNPVAIFKNTNMSALRHNSEKSKKIVLHCEKSASECLRHMASLYIFFLRLQFKLVLAWVYISGSGACYREILTAFLSTKHETTGFYHGPNTSHN